MATSIMKLPPLKPGYWWENVAPLGSDPKWVQKPMPPVEDLNLPFKLFGYQQSAFMARQYRK